MDGPVRRELVGDGVCVLTLDRPPANAINEELLVGLDEELRRIEDDPAVRAVVVTGAGRFFCGGFDLRARGTGDLVTSAQQYRDAHRRLLALPKPTVAFVNGHAIAGGLIIALACDVRVPAPTEQSADLRIGLNEVAIGASFPTAAIEIVRCRLSAQAAAELTLRAELLPFAAGERLGVFDAGVDGTLDAAIGLAARLGAYPADVYAHTKGTLVGDALARVDAVTLAEEVAISSLWLSEESKVARVAQRKRLEQGTRREP